MKPKAATRAFAATEGAPPPRVLLRLYVAGTSERSTRALLNAKQICETHLQGRYELDVIDIFQQPALAREDQIVAVPTLVRRAPLPLRRIIGDLSNTEAVLVGLGVKAR